MRVLILIAAAVLPNAAGAQFDRTEIRPPSRCLPDVREAAERTRSPGAQKMGDLPPAAELKAVMRRAPDGCSDPLVLRERIGANPDLALPVRRGRD
jgi:hypothetical protein